MLEKKKRMIRLEGGLLLLAILFLSACTYMLATVDSRVRATEKIPETEYSDAYYRFSELMAEIIVAVQERYVDEVEAEAIFEAALNGVFTALDRHSSYLSADNFESLEKSTEGEFSGIGIHIDVRDGLLTVISPIPGTPAARVGLQAWDRIVEIEGETTENITTMEAVKKLTGPVGTEVNIVVYRQSTREELPFTIIRDRIKIQSVYSNADDEPYVTEYFKNLLEKQHIGYIRLTKFSDNVSVDMEAVIRRLTEKGARGLILDGRFNSGGLLDEGILVSDLFLEKDQVIVATKGRLADQNRVYRARKPQATDLPMVMLVNQASASATEILAGALKDHHRAVLVGPEGQNTFGKAMVQSITPLRVSLEKDDNGNNLPNAIRLTTARYYTPDNIGEGGESLHGVGIEPDLSIEVPREQSVDLLTRGLLLGDPNLTEPGEDAPLEEGADEELDAEVTEDEGAGGNVEVNEEAEEETYTPFYRRNAPESVEPATPDTQLEYGVGVLKALIIVENKKAS